MSDAPVDPDELVPDAPGEDADESATPDIAPADD